MQTVLHPYLGGVFDCEEYKGISSRGCNLLSSRIGLLLRDWRKANGVKQESLAEDLGVSQSAVSHWESGRDIPSPRIMGRIVDLITSAYHDRLKVDSLVIQHQSGIRASFDIDGIKLVTASKGTIAAWPEFAKMVDTRLADRLVGEASHFMQDHQFVRSARRGDVAMISAISDRHIKMEGDKAFRHRWIAVFRNYGARVLVDMTYEACDPLLETGVENVVYFDSIAAL